MVVEKEKRMEWTILAVILTCTQTQIKSDFFMIGLEFERSWV